MGPNAPLLSGARFLCGKEAMPIYAYRCEGCGFQKDALQKLSDPPLKDCPECGQPRLAKQLTAAGFALKGTGWYVTDFREQSKKPADKAPVTAAASAAASSEASPGATSAATSGAISTPSAPAAPASTPSSSASPAAASTASTSATK